MRLTLVNLFVAVFLIQGARQEDEGPALIQITHPVDHAEGPTWDARKNILYYVDIHSGRVLAYHYNTSKVTKINLNGNVSPVIPSRKNPDLLIVGLNRSVVALEWDGHKKLGEQQVLTTISSAHPSSRFNDGKADKNGRLWWGTIGFENASGVMPNQASLYKITKENIENPTVARNPVTNSNGIAWNKANNKMYYIDTPTLKIFEFDYDPETGSISKENRTVFNMRTYADKITGSPDGMTIDDEDNLYVALYGGGSVIKVNPRTAELLRIIAIPARDVTSVAWGGPELNILYVTTSRFSLKGEERKQFPSAGSVFAIKNIGAKGLPPYTADIVDSIEKKLNLLENFLTPPEIFTQERNPRNTELSFWDRIVKAMQTFFP